MGNGAFHTACDSCGVKLDTFDKRNVSLGMSGVLCGRCGGIKQREQAEKIRKFTKQAKRRGLVVEYAVDGAGYATMYAVPPRREPNEAGDDALGAEGAENDEETASEGGAGGESAPRDTESPPLLRDPGAGTASE